MKNLVLTSALLALLTGPVVAVEDANDRAGDRGYHCLHANYLNSFKLIDPKTVVFEQSPSKRYRVTLVSNCRELNWHESVAVKSHTTCLGPGDSLIMKEPGGFLRRCMIKDVAFFPKPKKGQKAEEHSEAE